jgi:hypothetical protein
MPKWEPGTSGNPAGKKRGARHHKYASLENHKLPLLERLVRLALRGDRDALLFCCARIVAPLRAILPPSPPVNLSKGPLNRRGNAVLKATGRGHLSPDHGNALLEALLRQGQIIESSTLTDRISRLEAQLSQQETRTPPPSSNKRPREKL